MAGGLKWSNARKWALVALASLPLYTGVVVTPAVAPQTTAAAESSQSGLGAYSVRGIAIGATEKTLLSKLGAPVRKDPSEYGFAWYIYNKDYKQYAQYGVKAGRVVAVFGNGAGVKTGAGVTVGSLRTTAETKLGKPLKELEIGNVIWQYDDAKELGRYEVAGGAGLATLFYDIYAQNKIASILVMDKKTATTTISPAVWTAALQTAYEREIFDLANAVRVRQGLLAFKWSDAAAKSARLHSADMMKRNFFDHRNPSKKSPFDRMEEQGIVYKSAAENIAAGQANAIFAHEAWMNSAGHRKNVLAANTFLGVGVAFGGEYETYYTQNFYTPLKK